MRVSKLVSAAFALSLAASAATVMSASPALGAVANSCKTLKGSGTLKPPIPPTGSVNSTIYIKGTVSGCSPATKTGGSGTIKGTLKDTKPPSSCVNFAKGGGSQHGVMTTTWKSGRSSTLSVTTKEGTGANYNLATITGKVTRGLFSGHTVTGAARFTANSGACTSKPFSSFTFTGTKPLVLH